MAIFRIGGSGSGWKSGGGNLKKKKKTLMVSPSVGGSGQTPNLNKKTSH